MVSVSTPEVAATFSLSGQEQQLATQILASANQVGDTLLSFFVAVLIWGVVADHPD